MKTILLSFTITVLLVATVSGFVCPQNYCDNVDCPNVTEKNCDGKFVTKGSTCGCCDACRTLLKPGESCFALLLSGGTAPTVACPDGYSCNFQTFTCDQSKA